MGWTSYYEEVLPYVANEHSLVRGPGRQIAWASVPESFGRDAFQVTTSAQANAAATSISVDALEGDIPAGTMLFFGQAGEYARLTADADAGDTSLTVEALPAQIESGDSATYNPGASTKMIPAGTVMAELASGQIVPRSAVTGAETATHILESTAVYGDETGGAGYGVIVGGAIFENMLPDYADGEPWDTYKGELETAGVGTGWHWSTYADNTVS